MAKRLDRVVGLLINVIQENPVLAKEIRLAVKEIERFPAQIGEYVGGTRYSFTDPQLRFRIGYNFHPNAEEGEIITIHIF